MENGLVSQRAYTVTGAEQVRLPGPVFCSPEHEPESHAFSKSAYHTYPVVAPITDSPRAFYSSRSPAAQYCHPPGTQQGCCSP